ncbi:hypothetical protein Rhopal_003733-T1 [Rhodotorula paludigena]|uniref:F-box domain-containing protein n=1 Tax=Rhodotorula paludigena TaxID=86838 RepID=A0AAV5GLE1_9BASI|nr:hypothetical protein Rhopal_003733-T1 [Rhodotorula paludigena]
MKTSTLWNRLPSELKLLIIEMAIDDGRWEDLTTLEAILQVDRECHQLAAPIFWKSITLDERRFDTFDLSPSLPALEGIDSLFGHFLAADELPFDYFAHKSLTHLDLYGESSQPILLELAQISLPLRSLRLLLGGDGRSNVQRLQIGAALAQFPTLEFVELWTKDEEPSPPPLHLPSLRHLKLFNEDPFPLLALFLNCPLAVLDIEDPDYPWHHYPDRAGLIRQIKHFGETLEVVILTDSFFRRLSSELVNRIIRVRNEYGFTLIWKGECPDIWWTDLDGLDDYQVGWKRGGPGIISDEARRGKFLCDRGDGRWVEDGW